MDRNSVGDVLRGCLSQHCSDCLGVEVLVTSCLKLKEDVKEKIGGLYAFIDDNTVYYVGRTTDVLRRVGDEHCCVHIGGSEGVVMFLMHLLDKVCTDPRIREARGAVEREEIVAEIVRNFLSKLKIVLAICVSEPDRKCLTKAEECAKIRLKPILNPP